MEKGVRIADFAEDESGAKQSFFHNDSHMKLSINELHHILEETNKRKKSKDAPPKQPKFIVDDDYDELNQVNENGEIAAVKTLEKWHLEMRKRKRIVSLFIVNDVVIKSTEQNEILNKQRLSKKVFSDPEGPEINSEAVNRIFMDSDEEKECMEFYY